MHRTSQPIQQAIKALALATRQSAAADQEAYLSARRSLASLVQNLRSHDHAMNAQERVPTGDDYSAVLELLGIDATLRASSHLEIQPGVDLCAVAVLVEVVDPADGLAGRNGVVEAPALLDLITGELHLLDTGLGFAPHGCDARIWIRRGSCWVKAALFKHSLPNRLRGQDVIAHINEHGYTATLDLTTVVQVKASRGQTLRKGRYLVSEGWNHLFGPGSAETSVRFAYDRALSRVCVMQAWNIQTWVDCSFAEMADVTDSINNANPEALEAPRDWNLAEVQADQLPDWACSVIYPRF